MARRRNISSTPRRSRKSRKSNSSSSRFIYAGIGIAVIAVIGFILWLIWRDETGEYKFKRADLDKYVEMTQSPNLLNDGASVYVDMSDGMNYAYATPQSQTLLQNVINKLAGNSAISFYGLADEKISPLEMSHTQLFNYMMNPASYDKQKAPIERALETIVQNRQPALLMTDYEEYKGGVIEQAAYAKKYFTDWLAQGFNITFYKWDFVEGGKTKHMFLSVFDDNANRLNSLVENAVRTTDPSIATYVLGSRDFAYPTSSPYASLKDGGNYHNSKGQDVVTAVMSNGGKEDYVCYAKPYATASGEQGKFAPLDVSVGSMSEYYPIGVQWADAISNSKRMQETGVPQEDIYTHLFRNLFVNFGAQNGYSIDGIEARVFDMQETMKAVAEAVANGDSIDIEKIEGINKPEVNMVLTTGMEPYNNLPEGWNEIFVDFDNQFNGTFIGGVPTTNLLRANIVISKVTPKVNEAVLFFGWDGNMSLANSVKETLMSNTSSPQGRILFTYYIRTVAQ